MTDDVSGSGAADRPSGLAVLIVEDETLVAINLEAILEDLGHRVIGPVMRLDDLDRLIEEGVAADIAILDVNIAGERVFARAERLAAAGVPIIFATGYGAGGLADDWSHHPVVQKPYSPDDICQALATITG